MSEATQIKSDAVRRKLDDAKDNAKAAKLYDVFEAELNDALEVRKTVPQLLGRIDALEKALARPVNLNANLKAPAQPKAVQKLPTIGKLFGAAMAAEFKRRTDQTPVAKTIAQIFEGDDNRLARTWATKAASNSANGLVSGWAAELNNSGLGPLWQEMPDQSVLRLLLEAGAREPDLDGLSGLTVPVDGTGDTMQAAWLAENATIPVTEGSIGATTLNRRKLGLIATFSTELAKTSSPNIADVVTRGALEAISAGVDSKLMSTDTAIAGVAPYGLFNGAPTQASAGSTVANIMTDLKYLLRMMTKARRPVLLINPINAAFLSMMIDSGVYVFRDMLAKGNLFGLPVLQSHAVPETGLYALDLDRLYIWSEAPEIDFSDGATLVMLDAGAADPKMGAGDGTVTAAESVNVSDAATVTGGPAEVRSMFQTYGQAMRFIQPVTWHWIDLKAAWVSAVDYSS
ncbi:phage major capsid protein [Shimia thalassica]|uniref:phage major capsid protein n=1 Tax=Shimia thalassica TaxID=1715693 RepID=UPI0026E3A240|nr:phage major capsid protein [Shimia thalassica]MDO6483562.1 phage major capsid protein [Shimia thalassica]